MLEEVESRAFKRDRKLEVRVLVRNPIKTVVFMFYQPIAALREVFTSPMYGIKQEYECEIA